MTDRSVWMIKTHYPERHGYKRYLVDRAILLIRNPFDAIQSYFHMGMTNTHNQTLTEEVFQITSILINHSQAFNSLSHIWNSFLLNEIQVYSEFYRWWFQRSLQSHEPSAEHPAIPILLVRYEDLLADRDVFLVFFLFHFKLYRVV